MQRIDFDTIDSTNTFLKNNYDHLPDMTFVSAMLQTAGRGRNNRRWLSDRGNSLMFSVLLLNRYYMEHYRCLSILAAYSVIKALELNEIRDLSLKWPNDVYAGDEKICGILLEGVSREELECLIIGVGINVNQRSFEGDYLRKPTSVYLQTGITTDIEVFKEQVYEVFERNLKLLKEGHDFYDEIVAYDYLKGRKAVAEIRNCRKEVEILGINRDYTLRIRYDGNESDMDSGEITFHL
ncbi:MAG: biotin--[Erysipelotrichaceae bacterium]|nr:biotin--[acetyl-CoA-carboxylase] ligase [Erysipelotrichaceae bacterium]